MDSQALRELIAKRLREQTGGEDPSDSPIGPNNRVMPNINKDITPPKPDPEAAANAQINNAASRDPGIQVPNMNALTPEQQAIIKAHLDSVLAPVKSIGPSLDQLQQMQQRAPAADPATLMQQQGKPLPSDDVESEDLQKQFYKKKAQGE